MSRIDKEGTAIDPTVYAINSQMLGGPATAVPQAGEKTGWEPEGFRADPERIAAVLARVAEVGTARDETSAGNSGLKYGTPDYVALHERMAGPNTARQTHLMAGGAAIVGRGVRLAM